MDSSSMLSDFEFLERIGRGASGNVYRVRRKADQSVYCIKQIDFAQLEPGAQQAACDEVNVLASLDSPHVLRYFDSFLDFDTMTLNIVMELAVRGTLDQYLQNMKQQKKRLSEDEVWCFLVQICLGLHHIHSKNILHRDIKAQNIMLDGNNHAKIGDLGVAKMLDPKVRCAHTTVGTPYSFSPELVEDLPYNEKSDIWALGCLIYEMCTMRHPFEASNQAALMIKILRGQFHSVPTDIYSADLRSLIDRCLTRDPHLRPSVSDILSNPHMVAKAQQLSLTLPANVRRKVATATASSSHLRSSSQQLTNSLRSSQSSALAVLLATGERKGGGGGISPLNPPKCSTSPADTPQRRSASPTREELIARHNSLPASRLMPPRTQGLSPTSPDTTTLDASPTTTPSATSPRHQQQQQQAVKFIKGEREGTPEGAGGVVVQRKGGSRSSSVEGSERESPVVVHKSTTGRKQQGEEKSSTSPTASLVGDSGAPTSKTLAMPAYEDRVKRNHNLYARRFQRRQQSEVISASLDGTTDSVGDLVRFDLEETTRSMPDVITSSISADDSVLQSTDKPIAQGRRRNLRQGRPRPIVSPSVGVGGESDFADTGSLAVPDRRRRRSSTCSTDSSLAASVGVSPQSDPIAGGTSGLATKTTPVLGPAQHNTRSESEDNNVGGSVLSASVVPKLSRVSRLRVEADLAPPRLSLGSNNSQPDSPSASGRPLSARRLLPQSRSEVVGFSEKARLELEIAKRLAAQDDDRVVVGSSGGRGAEVTNVASPMQMLVMETFGKVGIDGGRTVGAPRSSDGG